MGSFTSHKTQISESAVRETYGFSSLSDKTRKSNHLQMHYKGSTFFSVI